MSLTTPERVAPLPPSAATLAPARVPRAGREGHPGPGAPPSSPETAGAPGPTPERAETSARAVPRPSTPGRGTASWRDAAVCQGQDPGLFFAPDGERGEVGERRVRRAKAVCAGCPVQAACLAWALENPKRAEYGVWGGLTEDERRLARGGRRRPHRRTA